MKKKYGKGVSRESILEYSLVGVTRGKIEAFSICNIIKLWFLPKGGGWMGGWG